MKFSHVLRARFFRYCIFGETLNAATQLALQAPSGQILVSREAKQCAQRTGRFEFESYRGEDQKTEAFFLKRSFKKSVWEIINRERGRYELRVLGKGAGWAKKILKCFSFFDHPVICRNPTQPPYLTCYFISDENINSIDGYTELNAILQDKPTEGTKSKFCTIL